ncbi:MAG TPA: hypothetical protein VFE26_15605 [Trebonia sp.]|jgi:hypothetical protein|nr:hypothetical protein [Trebonia sp.]
MPTTVNKLIGTLKLGDTSTGVAMEAQVTQVGLPQTVTRDSPVVVLTGDLIQAQAIYSNSVQGTLLIDWSDPDGVVYFVQSNKGQQMPFTFLPIGVSGPTYTGTLINDGLDFQEIAAGSNAVAKFTWPIQGQMTMTAPTAADDADG